jgi:rhodanese-related sulfurtransferase
LARKASSTSAYRPARQGGQPPQQPGKQTVDPSSKVSRWAVVVIAVIVVVLTVFAADFVFGALTPGPNATPLPSGASLIQGKGGTWTNVTPDRLAAMLQSKDFTLVNVKTPYIGEIAGTDLYIPYDQLKARASQLPQSKGAKILVYCRSGVESAQAAQTLLDLGYTNVWNLDGGMNAWTGSGRSLINLNRQ